ncbi:MAG: hypothetical protein JST90_05275 [Bacteroidetes bacterium]|nr:hypothetical protein [Bacteroidota bacterium]
MIEYLGPANLGAVVGWMLYYFMRKYKIFSPQTLGATITAFFGGEIVSLLHKISGSNTNFDLWYFVGVGTGFFMYALYVGTLSVLYAMGKIKSHQILEVAAGCGAGIDEDLDRVETLMEFERVLKDWNDKGISDEELKIALNDLDYSKVDYYKNKRRKELAVRPEIIEKFENQNMILLLK